MPPYLAKMWMQENTGKVRRLLKMKKDETKKGITEAAGRIGIRADRSARFHNDVIGVALNYDVLAEEISTFHSGGTVGESLKRVRKDYKKRK